MSGAQTGHQPMGQARRAAATDSEIEKQRIALSACCGQGCASNAALPGVLRTVDGPLPAGDGVQRPDSDLGCELSKLNNRLNNLSLELDGMIEDLRPVRQDFGYKVPPNPNAYDHLAPVVGEIARQADIVECYTCVMQALRSSLRLVGHRTVGPE